MSGVIIQNHSCFMFRTLVTELNPVVEAFSDTDFKKDYQELSMLVLVDIAADAEVEAAYETKKKMLSGVGVLKSRFAKALELFPTGRLVQERVDKERHVITQMRGVMMDIEALEAVLQQTWEAPQLPNRTPKQSVHFPAAQVEVFKNAWAKWAIIQGKVLYYCIFYDSRVYYIIV
jgi:hypothetical protein